MNNRVFFQHPDLMRLLRVHENVMTIMMNILTAQQGATATAEHDIEEVVVKVNKVKWLQLFDSIL
jgi:hypothetical protein